MQRYCLKRDVLLRDFPLQSCGNRPNHQLLVGLRSSVSPSSVCSLPKLYRKSEKTTYLVSRRYKISETSQRSRRRLKSSNAAATPATNPIPLSSKPLERVFSVYNAAPLNVINPTPRTITMVRTRPVKLLRNIVFPDIRSLLSAGFGRIVESLSSKVVAVRESITRIGIGCALETEESSLYSKTSLSLLS